MENASKALIIAGAILLAILIIGLGVFIYNQASNTVSDTGMDQVAIRQFNGQFEPYINKTLDSTAAKALIDTANQVGNGKMRLDGITNKNQIQTGHKYMTDVAYSNGVISQIILSDVNSPFSGGSDPIDDAIAFNAQFTPYFNRKLTDEEFNELRDLVNRVNSQYGPGTVAFSEGENGQWTCYGENGWVARSAERFAGKMFRIEEIEYARSTMCSF